jgi:hypothetical protein
VSVTLYVYDSAGLLVRTLQAGSAPAALSLVQTSADPYNPATGPLILSQGAWSFSYDGDDGSGAVLRNGVYLFVVQSQQGGGVVGTVKFQVTVIGNGGAGVVLVAVPNPVRSSAEEVSVQWQPSNQVVELKVYDLARGLVRSLGDTSSPAQWNLRTGDGEKVADGVYFISARIPGQRRPTLFKLVVTR